MPVKTTTPKQETTIIEKDIWRVTGVHIGFPNTDKPNTIDLEISEGKIQSDETVDWLDTKRFRVENTIDSDGNPVEGEQYFDDVCSVVTTGESLYKGIRDACYNHAIARGWIPGGTIE